MDERCQIMRFHQKPAIRRLDIVTSADTRNLGREALLIGFVEQMLNRGVGVNDIEGTIRKRQVETAGDDPRKHASRRRPLQVKDRHLWAKAEMLIEKLPIKFGAANIKDRRIRSYVHDAAKVP